MDAGAPSVSPIDRMSLRLGLPSSVKGNEFVLQLGTQIVGFQTANEPDRRSHLCEVLGAVGAGDEVALKPTALGARQLVFEIVGHKLDSLLTHDVTSAEKHC